MFCSEYYIVQFKCFVTDIENVIRIYVCACVYMYVLRGRQILTEMFFSILFFSMRTFYLHFKLGLGHKL